MKRKILIVFFALVCAVCLAAGVSACFEGETEPTLVMEEGYVYITDFSVNYTSESESPDGNINESAMSTSKSASPQKCYIVMDFNIRLVTDNKDNSESVTVKFTVNNAAVAACRVDYAETSATSSDTSDNVTVLTVTFTLPEKANTVKSERVVVSLTPDGTGEADISYDFICETKTPYVVSQCDGCVTVTQDAIAIKNNGLLEYTLNSDSYSVTGIGTSGSHAIVKSEHNGIPVTSIGSSAFYKCTSLISITIGNNIASIGSSAFSGCYKLVEVRNLSSLAIIAGDDGYGSVGYYAKNVYTSTSGESKLIYGDDYVFYNVNQEYYLIEYTGNDIEITLPDNINGNAYSLYDYAFCGCSSLTSITIPNTIISFGNYLFYGCSAQIAWGNNPAITTIDRGLFSGYEGTSITIPDGIISIGEYAFYNRTSLTNVILPDSVTSVGDYAFYGCTSLSSISLGNGITEIGSSTFDHTAFEWENDSLYIDNCLMEVSRDISSFEIKDGTRIIANSAFYHCKLTSVTIPNSVVTIGDEAFISCANLTSVSIPNSVTYIGERAFDFCIKLESATIGNSVTYIGDGAFVTCRKLSSITIPDSVTYIGVRAFSQCLRLTSVKIGSGVTSIEEGTFDDCERLTSVTIPDGVTSIGDNVFSCCFRLTSVTIGNSVTSIGDYAFYECSSLTKVTFKNSTGWYVTENEGETNGTDISSDNLSNTSTAASYLKNTYCNYYWYRV